MISLISWSYFLHHSVPLRDTESKPRERVHKFVLQDEDEKHKGVNGSLCRNPVHPTKPKTQSYLGNSFRVKQSISMVDRRYWEVLRLKKTMHSLGPHWLEQCSPTFLTPGTGFVEDSFPMDWGRGSGLDFTCCSPPALQSSS